MRFASREVRHCSPRVRRPRKQTENGSSGGWSRLRRFRRRWLARVIPETYLIGWVLNLKRLAGHLGPALQPT